MQRNGQCFNQGAIMTKVITAAMPVAAIAFANAQTMDELKRDGNGGSNNPAIRRQVSPGA